MLSQHMILCDNYSETDQQVYPHIIIITGQDSFDHSNKLHRHQHALVYT